MWPQAKDTQDPLDLSQRTFLTDDGGQDSESGVVVPAFLLYCTGVPPRGVVAVPSSNSGSQRERMDQRPTAESQTGPEF